MFGPAGLLYSLAETGLNMELIYLSVTVPISLFINCLSGSCFLGLSTDLWM